MIDTRELRKQIDEVIYVVENRIIQTEGYVPENEVQACEVRGALHCYNVLHDKLVEAKMWAGKVMGVTGGELPEEYRDECDARKEDVLEESEE